MTHRQVRARGWPGGETGVASAIGGLERRRDAVRIVAALLDRPWSPPDSLYRPDRVAVKGHNDASIRYEIFRKCVCSGFLWKTETSLFCHFTQHYYNIWGIHHHLSNSFFLLLLQYNARFIPLQQHFIKKCSQISRFFTRHQNINILSHHILLMRNYRKNSRQTWSAIRMQLISLFLRPHIFEFKNCNALHRPFPTLLVILAKSFCHSKMFKAINYAMNIWRSKLLESCFQKRMAAHYLSSTVAKLQKNGQ